MVEYIHVIPNRFLAVHEWPKVHVDVLPSAEPDRDKSHYFKSFWNHTFDKGRLKSFVLWFLKNHGEHKTVRLVEELKNVGLDERVLGSRALENRFSAAKEGILLELKIKNVKKDFIKLSDKN